MPPRGDASRMGSTLLKGLTPNTRIFYQTYWGSSFLKKREERLFCRPTKNSAIIHTTPLHQTLPTARLLSFSLLKACEGPNVHLSCLYFCSTQHTAHGHVQNAPQNNKKANACSSFSGIGTPQNRASFGGFRWP